MSFFVLLVFKKKKKKMHEYVIFKKKKTTTIRSYHLNDDLLGGEGEEIKEKMVNSYL